MEFARRLNGESKFPEIVELLAAGDFDAAARKVAQELRPYQLLLLSFDIFVCFSKPDATQLHGMLAGTMCRLEKADIQQPEAAGD